jgi:hypothetical protein
MSSTMGLRFSGSLRAALGRRAMRT